MADSKLSELTELAAPPAVDDELYIRDISEAAIAESKRITVANLMKSIMKAGVATETTNGDGKIDITFAVAFASTPAVVVTLIGDVDYYPVITARSTAGFTVKILKTAHTHTFSDTSSSGGGHSHTQGVTGEPSATTAWGKVIDTQSPGYYSITSGDLPDDVFIAVKSTASLTIPTTTHTHTNPSTSSVSNHTHSVSGTTGSRDAGNLLASTEVTFSYIAMIP